ncbi:hypothetical protein JY651_44030 [Pyxidicoccus parkwayensis]|uniref:Secreted protein n=1 Tax=Pyxidicoccus parkwayensis TaxID=2813578 RepID=A0ABX7NUE7_9BACT|nr:hypothetical protein [Pyxidicoccus parkwaysis]QSQ22041.1 hypothetical protein JY651_44030 [Pyxidicoccus parkwaysis]
MRIRYRLMLAGAVALVVALVAVALWPAAPVEHASPVAPPPEASVAPLAETSAPAPVQMPGKAAARVAPVLASSEERSATMVALGPGDVAPEPEVENPPPQENDEIVPELPQTAQWRLEKTTHITALLGRDVERLEREREEAETRGDERRSAQLQTLLQRHRARLHELREEIQELNEAAKQEQESSGE